ncbi:hypothetical protein [Tatumella morbirosei]|nr:hypothetical protein [Tatumella morbirosei]
MAHGFVACTEPYSEGGIEHIEMFGRVMSSESGEAGRFATQ